AVLDRNGFALAVSTPSHRVVADPMNIVDPGATAALLAPILGVDATVLTEQLTPDAPGDRYELLARNVDNEAIARIEHLEEDRATATSLVGVYVRPEEDRVYPAGDLARAVVGKVDPDEQGIYGVEQIYDAEMTGVPGSEQLEVGRFGSISVGSRKVEEATAGHDLVLTLDQRIQYVAEQALVEHCDATGAQGATAVMADPRTGEILAMATARRGDDGCFVPNYNSALVDAFEPGSVVKPVVVAAAVEELGYTSETLVDVPSRISVGGKTFIDHPEHPPAPFPISEILAESMNVGTILLAQRLSADTVYRYLTDFGFGQPTELGLTGESSGRLRAPEDWWGADHASIPIGQGVSVNATQLLSAYNVIANGGEFVPPTLVKSLEAPGGLAHGVDRASARRVISTRTAEEVTGSLVAVVNTGTGTNAAINGYQVAGKTGTAWKVFDDGSGTLGYGAPGNRRYVVTFAGFLPADDPQLSLVVVVDEPVTDTTA
ncbi:MAG: penicillin-binding protein 2, partial [Actinomycetota bacterium]